MSEIKFSCPACGQHLSATEAYSGLTITCPSCNTTVKVPGVAAPVWPEPPPIPPAHGGAAPLPPPIPKSRPTYAQTATPASQRPPEPAIKSGSKTGLIVGLVIGGVFLLLLVGAIGIVSYRAASRKATAARQQRSFPAQTFPGRRLQTSPQPFKKETQVQTDAASVEIPAEPVAGTVGGAAFSLKTSKLMGNMLQLEAADGYSHSLMIFTFLEGTPAGQTVIIPRKENEAGYKPVPHVHMHWKENGQSMVKVLTSGYSMRLEFGPESNGVIPGKLYFEAPAEYNTKVEGTFKARRGP